MKLNNKVIIIIEVGWSLGRAATTMFRQEGAKVVAAGWHKENVEMVKNRGVAKLERPRKAIVSLAGNMESAQPSPRITLKALSNRKHF